MLVRLFRQLVRGEVIFLAVCHGSGIVGVRCKIVKLRNSIVRTLWHKLISTWLDAQGNELGAFLPNDAEAVVSPFTQGTLTKTERLKHAGMAEDAVRCEPFSAEIPC